MQGLGHEGELERIESIKCRKAKGLENGMKQWIGTWKVIGQMAWVELWELEEIVSKLLKKSGMWEGLRNGD